jgi:hypothetical protein
MMENKIIRLLRGSKNFPLNLLEVGKFYFARIEIVNTIYKIYVWEDGMELPPIHLGDKQSYEWYFSYPHSECVDFE